MKKVTILYDKSKKIIYTILETVISTQIAASELYHLCCHTIVHTPTDIMLLKNFYKMAFFLMQAIYYLRTETYISTKRELFPLLETNEQILLAPCINWEEQENKILSDPEPYFELLIHWSSDILIAI